MLSTRLCSSVLRSAQRIRPSLMASTTRFYVPNRSFSDQNNQNQPPQQQQQQQQQQDAEPSDSFFDSLEQTQFDSQQGQDRMGGRGRGRGRGGRGRGGRSDGQGMSRGSSGASAPGAPWRIQQQIANQSAVPVQPGNREIGTVKWFDASKGFGFIYRQPNNDQVFVHFTNIAGTGFRSLEEGLQVDFIVAPSAKGPVASDVRIKV